MINNVCIGIRTCLRISKTIITRLSQQQSAPKGSIALTKSPRRLTSGSWWLPQHLRRSAGLLCPSPSLGLPVQVSFISKSYWFISYYSWALLVVRAVLVLAAHRDAGLLSPNLFCHAEKWVLVYRCTHTRTVCHSYFVNRRFFCKTKFITDQQRECRGTAF